MKSTETRAEAHLGLKVSSIGLCSFVSCSSSAILLDFALQLLDGGGHVGLVMTQRLQLLLLLAYHLGQGLHLLAHGLQCVKKQISICGDAYQHLMCMLQSALIQQRDRQPIDCTSVAPPNLVQRDMSVNTEHRSAGIDTAESRTGPKLHYVRNHVLTAIMKTSVIKHKALNKQSIPQGKS